MVTSMDGGLGGPVLSGKVTNATSGWDFAYEVESTLTPARQLSEARFLAAFCCAVYGQREPKQVCATAAACLHDYFGYRQAQFAFAAPEVEDICFQPVLRVGGRQGRAARIAAPLKKRTYSVAGGSADSGYDITVQLPTGLGDLRLLEAGPESHLASGDFLQGIGECLGSALATALEYQRLQELSLRDSLTGLLNRRAFEELLEIEEGRREDRPYSLIMIDIDNFKSLNDRFGHPAGDQVIAGVAGAIRDALRGADLATRYGGEEFAVLLPGTAAIDAFSVAERIRSRINALRFDLTRRRVRVTASLGLANRYDRSECSLKQLLALADDALYQAKGSGKNITVIHQNSLAANHLSA